MLNEILEPFKDYFSFLNLFEYITFRAGASAILSLLISFIFGPVIVRKLTELQIGESIADYGPDSHHKKQSGKKEKKISIEEKQKKGKSR